jgi:hypothetical protein
LSERHEQGFRKNNRAENSISRRDGASARCSASNHPDQPTAFCPLTPPSKTLSTSSAISHPAARTASFEKKLSGRGELRQPHELELGRLTSRGKFEFP